jgi:hypothetical protein
MRTWSVTILLSVMLYNICNPSCIAGRGTSPEAAHESFQSKHCNSITRLLVSVIILIVSFKFSQPVIRGDNGDVITIDNNSESGCLYNMGQSSNALLLLKHLTAHPQPTSNFLTERGNYTKKYIIFFFKFFSMLFDSVSSICVNNDKHFLHYNSCIFLGMYFHIK